ncbi:MAG: DUF4907 domain-containing protein [Bacteroidia bacterium]|jgi:hypothetical protein|nr:DUF4907 domain-containing protein [Bacteroidia bacterium]
MKPIHLAVLLCISLAAVGQTMVSPQSRPKAEGTYQLRLIPGIPDGVGFEILRADNVLIRQAHIPAVAGLHGFPDTVTARQAGELMLLKLTQGQLPPTLTRAEIADILAGTPPLRR